MAAKATLLGKQCVDVTRRCLAGVPLPAAGVQVKCVQPILPCAATFSRLDFSNERVVGNAVELRGDRERDGSPAPGRCSTQLSWRLGSLCESSQAQAWSAKPRYGRVYWIWIIILWGFTALCLMALALVSRTALIGVARPAAVAALLRACWSCEASWCTVRCTCCSGGHVTSS